MRLSFVGVFADAGALWRGNRDLLVRVSAVFFFLPYLALRLFVALPEPGERTTEQALELMRDWYLQNIHWISAAALVQALGSAAVFVLLLDSARPTLREALLHALRLLPVFAVALLIASMLFALGAMAFIVPGLYVAGRTMVTGPLVVAERRRNPIKALADAIRLTHGNGWILLLVTLTITFALLLPGNILDEIAVGLGGPIAQGVLSLAIAAIAAAGMLAQTLVQAAAYRALVPRQGI